MQRFNRDFRGEHDPVPLSREVKVQPCRAPGAARHMTSRDPAICDEMFYHLVERIRTRLIEKYPNMKFDGGGS